METAKRQNTSSARQPRKRPRVSEENRSRASRACDRCRRLKEKCQGGTPCIRCTRNNRSCEFTQATTFPGRPSSSDISENEERVKHLEKIAAYFLGDVSLSLSSLRSIAEKIQRSSSTVEGASDVEDLTLRDEKFVVKTLSHNTAHYSGEFSHWNFSQKVRKRVDECLTDGQEQRIKENWRATQLQSPASSVFALLQSLPPRHVVNFLVQIYFQYAQTNLFFIEEKSIREKLDILHNAPSAVSGSDAAWICSVLMVLAIGTQFAHMASGPLDQINEMTEPTKPASGDDVGVELYRMACKLIPDVIAIASLESVQACLLLAHYSLPLDTQGLAYTYLGLAIKVAIQNGMHRKYVGRDFDSRTVETRNRLWWTAYTLEKRICILHGRPPSVTPNDVDADLPVDSQEFHSPDTTSNFQNISALIHLTCRLGDISNAIILLRRCPKHLRPNYFDRLFEIRSQLRTWWSSLPATLICRDLTPSSPLFRNNIHLKLCFHLNEIYMGRPFIFFADTKSPSPGSDSEAVPAHSASLPSPKRSNTRATLVADAESAAMQIIELCSLLNKYYGLAGASYTEFSSCRAALLVILAQSLNGRTEILRSVLGIGMRLIKRMAINIDSVKSEVSVIDALETAIKKLDSNGTLQTRGDEKQKDGGYEKFRSWAALRKIDQLGSGLAQSSAQSVSFADNFRWTQFSGMTEGAAEISTMEVTDAGTMADSFMMPELEGMFDRQWDAGFGVDEFDTGMGSNQY
ncbi:C6 transcription factor [Leptodontidium sp. MPI-SDFR-AT-0119]|nr:C6 transcription factor [Leptodontidium sp. MPI-SDFR-AT-0119]